MLETLAPVYSLREVVVNPTLFTALALLVFSALNEIIALFPFSIVIASQVAFIVGGMDTSLFIQLIFLVAVPVGVGSALGTLPLYALSYFGGRPAINKYEKYLKFSWHDIEKLGLYLNGGWYEEILIVVLRSIPLIPSIPVTIATGIIRVKFIKYILLTTLGFILRMILTLLIMGFSLGNLFKFINFIYNV